MTEPYASLTSQEGAQEGDSTAKLDPILAANKPKLFAALRSVGAAIAVITYSGEGDSGYGNIVAIYGAEGQKITPRNPVEMAEAISTFVAGQWKVGVRKVVLPLPDALDAFTDRAIELLHSGFENGDGGSGEVTFDVYAERVEMEHRDYFVDSNTTYTDL
ncbi:hypothetical protein DOT66_24660 [Ralstonia pseudosolanacearum]|uniref:DUF6878 family protein n=1 Tax=Ralstonia pseudosolanacearum TaxID=1310165 RepID=UPI000A7A6DEE|nr:DUF6878 family protein [Ralstonia pseudosolanacearum]AZU59741.1 hypothetical protein CFM90_26310 [Ralstonia solanacearum]NKF92560.1 hypothetical protein [Ralstonia solanacearum]RAA04617.1 hypothetical protein DOT66_24660 [Ralstonia pseudosolanacearum]